MESDYQEDGEQDSLGLEGTVAGGVQGPALARGVEKENGGGLVQEGPAGNYTLTDVTDLDVLRQKGTLLGREMGEAGDSLRDN